MTDCMATTGMQRRNPDSFLKIMHVTETAIISKASPEETYEDEDEDTAQQEYV